MIYYLAQHSSLVCPASDLYQCGLGHFSFPLLSLSRDELLACLVISLHTLAAALQFIEFSLDCRVVTYVILYLSCMSVAVNISDECVTVVSYDGEMRT
jgi:hypothetical protein